MSSFSKIELLVDDIQDKKTQSMCVSLSRASEAESLTTNGLKRSLQFTIAHS